MKKEKRVGVITHYHNSKNYGGLLQAYALIKVIEKLGYKAEQIRFDNENKNQIKKDNRKVHRLLDIPRTIINCIGTKLCQRVFMKREKKCAEFRDLIPHSFETYNKLNISDSQEKYDIFITGSDQVWNPIWFYSEYFLDFVSNKKKLSYAASIGQNVLTTEQKSIFEKYLKDFYGISLREEKSKILLSEISLPCTPQVHLDPTLLLEPCEWDLIAVDRIIKERYVFVYSFSGGNSFRNIVNEFAKSKKLKIVFIPHYPVNFKFKDICWGDIKIKVAGPCEFISLIKFADYVFTDSFHASVFSLIYKKEVFTFKRNGAEGMSERINTLFNTFGINDHFFNEEDSGLFEKILNIQKINYEIDFLIYKDMKHKSIDYLKESLGDK